MNRFSLLLNLAFALLVAGVALMSSGILGGTIELVTKLWQRVFKRWTQGKLQDLGMVRNAGSKNDTPIDWKPLVLILTIPVLAIWVHDFLLSPLVILIGGLGVFWMRFQARQADKNRVNEDAEMASLQLRSLLEVDHSLLSAIQSIDLPVGTMKKAFAELANRLQMRQPPDQAVQPLRVLPGKVTARLGVLIANSAHITEDLQSALLKELERETHRQKLIRSKIRETLALVRGTVRLLQGVVATAIGFVLLSPDWRNFFLQDTSHRVLLTTLILCAILASLYFEFEIYQLSSGEGF